MKNIVITYDDMHFEKHDDSDDYYDVHDSGYIVDGWFRQETDDMSGESLIALHESAKVDIDLLIECEHCSSNLMLDNDEHWVCNLTKNNIGMNRYEEKHHIHKPEKLWYEVFVDLLDQYGCYETDGLRYYSDYHTVDYARGIDRQYCIHIEWDITEAEGAAIDVEIALRIKNMRKFYDKYLGKGE
jgi:hypothetical protein